MRAPTAAGVCNRPCNLHEATHASGARLGRLHAVVLAAALIAGGAGDAGAAVVIIQPPRGTAADTYLRSAPDTLENFGDENNLVVSDESMLHRVLVKFDFSGFGVDDTVHSATLDLYLRDAAGPGASIAPLSLYGVNRTWNEGDGNDGANWVEADNGDRWTTPGGDHVAPVTSTVIIPEVVNTWYSWDITDLVRDWIADPAKNYGLLLKMQSELVGEGIRRGFVSNDDSDATHLPRISVSFGPKNAPQPGADSAYAEIVPRNANGGTTYSGRYSIRIFAKPTTSTGVNYAEIPMGTDFRLVSVDSVFVDGILTAFTNGSDSSMARIGLPTKLINAHRLDIRLRAIAPIYADRDTIVFTSFVDDIGSPVGPTAAKEGSANTNVLDGNRWHVIVNPPLFTAIRILPDSATVSSDSTRDFDAVLDLSIGGTLPVEPTWSVLGGVGSINATGLFTAGTAGNGKVRAVFVPALQAALSDSAPVTVTPGAPATIAVSPDTLTLSADLTQQFTADVRDADGNAVATSVTWSTTGGIGTVDGNGLFDAVTAGSGFVRAVAGSMRDSSAVTVTPGAPATIAVSPDTLTLSADVTQQFTADVRDADGNAVATSITWSTTGGIGTVDGNGLFDAVTAGSGFVRAVAGAARDSSAVTVTPGAPATIAVSPDTLTLSADLTQQFTADVRDADGNAVSSSVTWSTTGGIGTVDGNGLFDAVTAGSGFVHAIAGAMRDSSAVTVVPGTPASVSVSPDSAEVSADSTKLFTATVTDADGNLTSIALHWGVRGGIGTVANGLFTATTAGDGWVRASSGLQIDSIPDGGGGAGVPPLLADSARVVVVPGAAASLLITPGPLTVSTDTTLQFSAQGQDADGNSTPSGVITWSGGAGIGDINPATGLFDPRTIGVGTVHAASSLGPSADSPPITVVAGAAAAIEVKPDSATVRRGTTQAFVDEITDLDGNPVTTSVSWTTEGGVGDVDSAGLFSAGAIGSGIVIAAVGSKSDTSTVYVPDPGVPRLLSIGSSQGTVTEGQQGLPLTLRYRNESTETLRAFAVRLRPRTPLGEALDSAVVVLDIPITDSLPPGTEGTFSFHAGLGDTLQGGDEVVLDAVLLAADEFGFAYSDSGADTTASWTVQSAARLVDSQNSVWPRRVARGSSGIAFLLGGMNAGGVEVTLDPEATRLRFSDGISTFDAPLGDSATFAPDSAIGELDFEATPVPPTIATGTYPLTLILAGTDANGMAFADTLATVGTNAVTVIPPYVTVVPVAVAGGSARPGEQRLPLLGLDLQNGYADTRTLASLAITNGTVGPGSAAQRDAEIAVLSLYWDRNADGVVTVADTLLKNATFSSGRATLGSLGFAIAAESTSRLIATVNVGLSARDGDSLDLLIGTAADLTFTTPTSIDGTFPVNPAGRLVVEGSVAAQFTPIAIDSRSAAAGETLLTALDVTIPANGYAVDTLRALSISQRGTARAGDEISRVRLVRRAGTDTPIGDMVWTGARWILTGLSTPIASSGLRLAVLVDISAGAGTGRTIDLAIPAGENAVSVASANDGPIDAAVSSGGVFTIATSDQVLVLPTPLSTGSLAQGGDNLPSFAVTLVNRYFIQRTLTALRLTAQASLLDPSKLDGMIEAVVLRKDEDGDGNPDVNEPVLGSAPLTNGSVFFNNLSGVLLPRNIPVDLLATVFVANSARDGDSLRLTIAQQSDLTIVAASEIAASFPMSSTPLLPVVGMTQATIANHGAPPRTLPPGEENVLVLDITAPANGYQPDTLQSVRLLNGGTAINGRDISALRLYRDGGDGVYGAGSGDDFLVDTLPFDGTAWVRSALTVPLPVAGTRLYVAADIGSAPADSATIAMLVPLAGLSGEPPGLVVASANDGPIDLPVVNSSVQTISTSPLLVDIAADRATASVGQSLALTMNARNVGLADTGAVTIEGIIPTLTGPSGSGSVTILSGPVPDSLVLAPGEQGTFTWMLRADAPGGVTFTGQARGRSALTGDPISSTPIASPPLAIVNPPTEVSLFPTNLAPATVARGTTNFVPISLTFSTTAPPPAGSAEVWSLTLALDDGSGNPVAASDLLERVAVREAANVFHVVDTLMSAPQIALLLSSPIPVAPSDPVTVVIALDIREDTQVPSFRLRILDETAIGARDANSGEAVPLRLEEGTFPVATGAVLVTAPGALQFAVEDLLGDGAVVNRGQTNISALGLLFHSFGDSGIAGDVRITEVQAVVEDSSGMASDPALFTRVILANGPIVYGDVVAPLLDAGVLRVPLATPLILPVNSEVAANLSISISAGTTLRHLRFRVDPAHVPTARDAVTGAPIGVTLLADFEGALVRVASPAALLEAAPRAAAGGSVYPGTAGIPILRARVRHPGSADEASARLEGIAFRVTDEIGNPIAASLRLQSVTAFRGGVSIGSVNVSENASPGATIPISTPPVLAPGDSAEIELRAAVRGGAPAGRVRIWIDADGFDAKDVNQGTGVPFVADEAPFPLVSALLTVLAPPSDPIAWFRDSTPATVAHGATGVPLGELSIVNPAGPEAGTVEIETLVLAGENRGGIPLAAAAAFAATRATVGDSAVATGEPGNLYRIVFTPPRAVAPGETLALAIEADLLASPTAADFRILVTDSSVVLSIPGEGLPAPQARAAAGESFPFATGFVGFTATNFAQSASNYPNPFEAGREPTQFVFFMEEAGEIDIAVYNALGEPVLDVARALPAGPGMITPILWDGRNADGDLVLSGVYLVQIGVRYGSGRSESLVRKVAVLR